MTRIALGLAVPAALAILLAGCGGGGGGSTSLASTPPPPPPPPPPTSSAVDIFPSPASQEFATIGVGADIRIRYDSATNKYEVMAGNLGWGTLLDDPNSAPLPGNPNTNFRISGYTDSIFLIRAHHSYSEPDVRYLYSNLAAWSGGGQGGYVAFGMATTAGGVPTTGSATYNGFVEGSATDTYFDPLVGAAVAGGMEGSINLAFNFGSGSLSGSFSPVLYLGTKIPLSTVNFTNTVYSTGSTSFSGRFNTNVAGNNSFSGLFTGPNAQELIGKFALPYISPVNGNPQQSQGAFIAKK